KGKGYEQAEEDPESFHGVSPSCTDNTVARPSFTEVFGQTMSELAAERSDVVAITAAMAKGTGLANMERNFPSRVYDVGIAEQHAVTFAAGLATGGLLPVVAIYSTFMQRAVDQVLHDVALPNLHVVFALDRAGAVGEDGETHQGFFDIALFKSLPNMTILAPSSAGEMKMFMRHALSLKGPVLIRYPKGKVECEDEACMKPLMKGRGVMMRKTPRSSILVCALGPFAQVVAKAIDRLALEGVFIDLYSLRFACPIDEDYLAELCGPYADVVTLEDGAKAGGVGESIASILARKAVAARVSILGFRSMPSTQASRAELLCDAGLDEDSLYFYLRKMAAEAGEGRLYETIAVAAK
ncbi:MAG TPA: transketolase C-terminal domain-containing protein, partial [Rectinemataceae bacterium]|nr:transketolase C-terminal domain-containing protein [Rectinemataceae bacterium]